MRHPTGARDCDKPLTEGSCGDLEADKTWEGDMNTEGEKGVVVSLKFTPRMHGFWQCVMAGQPWRALLPFSFSIHTEKRPGGCGGENREEPSY